MTTNESIKAIKDYLRHSNISADQYSSIIFEDGQATLNSATKFFFEYDNGAMDLTSLNDEFICGLNMDELAELFPSLYYQVYCEDCNGSHEDCDHDGVIYPL
jgi:hypothetical protein